jgi:hypothetical protein
VACVTPPEGVALPVERAREAVLPVTTSVDVSAIGDRKRRAFLEHRTQLDHLELFDALATELAGKEHYHRLAPAWQRGEPPESSLLPPGRGRG